MTDYSEMKLKLYGSCFPMTWSIVIIWSELLTILVSLFVFFFISGHGESGKQELPGNKNLSFKGFLACKFGSFFVKKMSSAKMQPRLHWSICWLYFFSFKMISGALYHLELICEDNCLLTVALSFLFLINA